MTWLSPAMGVVWSAIQCCTRQKTIFLGIHQEGGHQKGAGAFVARPFVVESVVVDSEKYGVIYGAIYPISYGTKTYRTRSEVFSVE